MGLNYNYDATLKYKQNLYNIYLDLSGWGKTTIQVVAPSSGSMGNLGIYGTNDPNALTGVRYGNAALAINYNSIQATNLATGVATTGINAAGSYGVTLNDRFLKLAGGADVYRLLFFHQKGS